jgi:hypothetical protein
LGTAHAVSWLELRGRRVLRSVDEFNVSPNGSESLTHLGLDFGDGRLVTLGCASDGQSLQVGYEVLRDYDMGDSGRMEVREFGLSTGSTIAEVIAMVDSDQLTFGLILRTCGHDLFVFNWGDVL